MAGANLAVIRDHQITIHAAQGVLDTIPLTGDERTHQGYVAVLRHHGWAPDGLWGWTDTPDGQRPSLAVKRT